MSIQSTHSRQIHVKTVEERILPTIIAAEVERKKYTERAMMKGYTVNIAIGKPLHLWKNTAERDVLYRHTAPCWRSNDCYLSTYYRTRGARSVFYA